MGKPKDQFTCDWDEIIKAHGCKDMYELVESNYVEQGSWTALAHYLHVGYDTLRKKVKRWNNKHPDRPIEDVGRMNYKTCLGCGKRFELHPKGSAKYCTDDQCQKSRQNGAHKRNWAARYKKIKAERAQKKADAEVQEYSDKDCPYCGRKMEINMHFTCRACEWRRLGSGPGMEYGVKAHVY